jgi:thioredoxin-like negative regulator of GroEL
MSEKLQQAITSIKSGNQQLGQQLLAQVLQEQPDNELGWLWMSAVVSEDKRRYCIERVLRINPNNQRAKQALEQLKAVGNPQIQAGSQQPAQISQAIGQDNRSDRPNANTKTLLRDSVSLGVICGILGVPAILIAMFSTLLGNDAIPRILVFIIFISVGLASGVNLFRKGIGSFLAVSFWGGITGFVSSAVWSLSFGMLFMIPYAPIRFTPGVYLLICGIGLPTIFGLATAITTWIPRIFIDPNKLNEPFSVTRFGNYFKSGTQNQDSAATHLTVIQELPHPAKPGQKYWVNPDQEDTSVVFFLEDEILCGAVGLKSKAQFEAGISAGRISHELLSSRKKIPLSEIHLVTKQRHMLTIEYKENEKQKSHDLDLKNEAGANVVLDLLHEKLGETFEKSSRTSSVRDAITTPGIFFLLILLCAVISYSILANLTVNEILAYTGDKYINEVIDTLSFLLHDGGIFIISGLLLIITTGIMIYQLATLPVTTRLAIRENISDKLDQAIELIKSGDKQAGLKILAQVLTKEPNNESAWMWMAKAAIEEKKHLYYQKVLQINPHHEEALQALQNVRQRQAEAESARIKQVESLNIPQQPVAASEVSLSSTALTKSSPLFFWINPARKASQIIVLFEDRLLTAKCDPRLTAQVSTKLGQGNTPIELMTEKINIPFARLTRLEQFLSRLQFDFKGQTDHTETVRMDCKDQETSDEIVNAIQQKLGTQVERNVSPMSKVSILSGNGVLIIIILAISAFFFYAATDIQNNGVPTVGSARTRGIVAILDLLGPGGVACIGGVLLLIVLASMINSLIKPPLVTTLLRKDMQTISPQEEPMVGIKVRLVGISRKNFTNSLGAAALSDGLMVGLIGGLIGMPLPILFLLTDMDMFINLGMLIDLLIFLFSGIAVGVLFYQRKLPRGTSVIALGGLLGGAISGTILGLLLGSSFIVSTDRLGLELPAGISSYSAVVIVSLITAVSTSLFAAATSWIPGLFIKPDPNTKLYDWKDGKTELDIARAEKLDAETTRSFRNRLIIAGVAIAILFISTLCKSLVN